MKRALVVLAATVALGSPAAASDYVFRVRGPVPATSSAPPAPVLELRVVPGTTYRTARPLRVVLAELAAAGRSERTIQLDWNGRTLQLDWTLIGITSPEDAASFFDAAVIRSFFPTRGTAWLDAAGHLNFRETHPDLGFRLSSTGGIALATYGFRAVP